MTPRDELNELRQEMSALEKQYNDAYNAQDFDHCDYIIADQQWVHGAMLHTLRNSPDLQTYLF